MVQQGDLVFAEALPARVVLADEVEVGSRIEPGTTVALSVAEVPEVTIPLGQDQRAYGALTGTPVVVEFEDQAWEAVVGEAVTTDTGESSLTLTAPDGGPVCGADCADLPFTVDALRLGATVVIEPEVDGPLVPVSALITGPDGTVSVRTEDGRTVPVSILGSDGARAVVEGLDVGTVILLHGEDGATTDQPTQVDPAAEQ
ncbi:hypothetical protein N869_07800 [Cellulomonas bogoriensis 69B4 = DSM 16987]|uniref:Uncharacterized protein n=1 Tax=Cellulomonas bogoriensis 69B4 = DSM 16987 TaxID=1386082 RepID=A0A0A0C149_9CELL|nr:hypothetical protein N869_07800 [Cellulomonas bogoriensis 69B4 = DSM 16987]